MGDNDLALAGGPVDVMLIPNLTVPAGKTPMNKKDAPLFIENRKWGSQWQKKGGRMLLEVHAKAPLAEFTAAVKRAASLAQGKEVILFTGHGADATMSSTNQSSFDTIPEDGLMDTHPFVILKEDLVNRDFAMKQGDKWVPKPLSGPVKFRITQSEIDTKWQAKWLMFDEIGAALVSNKVARFRLLTCDIGSDQDFIDRFAKILGVPVSAYKEFTITQEHTVPATKGLVQLWIGPIPPVAPPVTGPTDPQFSEIPHNSEASAKP